jgi:hypothetical protein
VIRSGVGSARRRGVSSTEGCTRSSRIAPPAYRGQCLPEVAVLAMSIKDACLALDVVRDAQTAELLFVSLFILPVLLGAWALVLRGLDLGLWVARISFTRGYVRSRRCAGEAVRF